MTLIDELMNGHYVCRRIDALMNPLWAAIVGFAIGWAMGGVR